jgi:hypothetical protein
MSSVSVFLAAASAALASVARGGNLVFHRGAVARDWGAANQFCMGKYGTPLASLHSAADNSALYAMKQANGDGLTWIGANDVAFEGAWSNVDGTAFDYSNWDAGQPDNYRGGQDCALMWQNGKWDDCTCDAGHFNFACDAPSWLTVDTVASDTWMLVHGVGAKNWQDARAWCEAQGAFSSLASVPSQQVNDWMWAAAQSKAFPQVWIGYNDVSSPNNWQWSDGSAVTFVNWLPGEPRYSGTYPVDCALFWHDNKWNNGDCTWTPPAFFCQFA